jgi:hypothetical protein
MDKKKNMENFMKFQEASKKAQAEGTYSSGNIYMDEYGNGSLESITKEFAKFDITDIINSALHRGKMIGADDIPDEDKDGLIDCNPLSQAIRVLEDLGGCKGDIVEANPKREEFGL